jgi:3-(3-hydroxy-phenyl)propionate hydroxylase
MCCPSIRLSNRPNSRTGQTGHSAIVIVGGGITGLTLACALASYGVAAVLLDEDNTVGVKGASSRGICYTQKSLEIFHRLGVYERIAAKGIQWSVGRTFRRQRRGLFVRPQAAKCLQPVGPAAFHQHPAVLHRGVLVDRIQRAGFMWTSAGATASPPSRRTGSGATLTVRHPRATTGWSADHVMDATGSRSPFRGWCQASGPPPKKATTAGALPTCASPNTRPPNATPGSRRPSTTTAPCGST